MPIPPSQAPAGPDSSSATPRPGTADEGDPGFPGVVFGQTELVRADYRLAVAHHPITKTWTRRANVALVLSLVGEAAVWWTELPAGWLLLLAVFGLPLLGEHQWAETQAQRWFRSTPPTERHQRFTFTPEALIVVKGPIDNGPKHEAPTPAVFPWTQMYQCVRTSNAWLFEIAPHQFLVVPRRAFGWEDQIQIEQLLDQHFGITPRRTRG